MKTGIVCMLLLMVTLTRSVAALEETRIEDDVERWRGCYYYAGETDLIKGGTRFYADLLFGDASFTGQLTEDSFIQGQEGQTLTSAVIGMSFNGMVSFTKAYDPDSGLTHLIMYLGTLSQGGKEIRGAWTIPETTSFGSFIMSERGYPCDS